MNHFTIRDIEAITGIKQHTLRIWELRYGIVEPKRTLTNIRYYDDNDLKNLLSISLLNKNGFKISKISKLTRAQIDQIILEQSTCSDCVNFQVHALMGCMLSLDEPAFINILNSNIEKSGFKSTVTEIIFPFLKHIGILWMGGTINPAFEHFVSNLIKLKLFAEIEKLGFNPCNEKTKKVLLFLPEGESHVLGLLFGHYLIRSAGHQSVYLGESLSDKDIDLVISTYKPDYIFTSVAVSMSRLKLQTWIDQVASAHTDKKIIVAGNGFISNDIVLKPNVLLVKTPDCLERILND